MLILERRHAATCPGVQRPPEFCLVLIVNVEGMAYSTLKWMQLNAYVLPAVPFLRPKHMLPGQLAYSCMRATHHGIVLARR